MLARPLSIAALLAVLCLGFGAAGPRHAAAASTSSIQGDVNCSGAADARDSLQILVSVANSASSAAGCVAGAGDVDCDGDVDLDDAMRILRFAASLPAQELQDCVAIGQYLVTPPTSEELIAAALVAGDISYEDSLRARAYALFDDPRLDPRFRSEIVDYHAAYELFTELLEKDGQLSQQLLDDLAPFTARPADPISIFNNPPATRGQSAPSAAAAWKSKPAAGGKLRVWVKDSPSADAQLGRYETEATRVWNAIGQAPAIFRYGLPDTLGSPEINPDSAIDIYFAPANEIDPRMAGCAVAPQPQECVFRGEGGGYTGYTGVIINRTSASYIMIDSSVIGPMLTSHIAHELMHTGQHAYDVYEPFWLKDSTATWGAVRVLQRLGVDRQTDFDYLPTFFQSLDKPLTRDEGLNRYASWLYFLSASMKRGDGVVTSIWEKAAADGIQNEKAVNEVFKFDDYFDDFALLNWNKKPPLLETYKAGEDTFPPGLQPKYKPWFFGAAEERTESDAVSNLSSVYYRYTFGDLVGKVTFTNLLASNPKAHVQALVKVGTEWEKPADEDWTGKNEKVFCRNLAKENISEVVVIISNSDMTNPLPGDGKLKVETKSTCQTTTFTGTYHYVEGYHEDWTVTADVEWVEGAYFCSTPCRAFNPRGTIDWTWKYGWGSDYADPPCDETHSGHLMAGEGLLDPSEQILILWEDPSNNDQYLMSGSAYVPATWFSTCENGQRTGLPFFSIPEPNVTLPTPTFTFPPTPPAPLEAAASSGRRCDSGVFTVPKNVTTFSGSCWENDNLKYEWNFRLAQTP